MSDIKITIDMKQVEVLLTHIEKKLDHQEPLLKAIGHSINENVRMTFRELKAPDGTAWKPLSPVTKYQRAKNKSGGRVYRKDGKGTLAKFTQVYITATPLNDTGVLRNSIAYRLSGQSVEIGTNVKYAALQNFGAKQGAFGKNKRNTPIPWGDVPARQFIPVANLPVRWENEVMVIVNDYLGIVP